MANCFSPLNLLDHWSRCKTGDRDATAGDGKGQELGSGGGQFLLDPRAGVGRNDEQDAATASRTADLGAKRSVSPGDGDEAVDKRSGDGRRVAAAQLPLLPQESRGFLPVGGGEGRPHGARDGGDVLEVAQDAPVAVDVALEDLPVIDAALARRAGVGEDKAAVELGGIACNAVAMDAIDIEFDGTDAAVQRGIIILTSGGNTDELRFDVLRNLAELFRESLRAPKRASAEAVAIIKAEEPEIPAPAGDSESVSRRNPVAGSEVG